jgi:hypothetical protein
MDIEKRNPDSKIGTIRRVTFEDIDIRTGTGLLLQGMPESPIEDLTLRNITVRVDKADDYAKRRKPVGGNRTTHDERDFCYARLPCYAAIAHVKGLTLENVKFMISEEASKQYDRAGACLREIDGATISGVTRTPKPEAGRARTLDLQSCRNLRFTGPMGQAAP